MVPTLLVVMASGGVEIHRELELLSEQELSARLRDVTVFTALDP